MGEKSIDNRLTAQFYEEGNVVEIARNLIGKLMCTNIGGILTTALITETEAYAGIDDKASHAYGGKRTKRTETMYQSGGTAYVYLCYGMHPLFNVITNKKDIPHAVLIRGIYPISGLDTMLARTNKSKFNIRDGIGPGKVSKLMGITMQHNAISLIGNVIWLCHSGLTEKLDITTDKRVGIDYAGEDALLPYRFIVKNYDTIINYSKSI